LEKFDALDQLRNRRPTSYKNSRYGQLPWSDQYRIALQCVVLAVGALTKERPSHFDPLDFEVLGSK